MANLADELIELGVASPQVRNNIQSRLPDLLFERLSERGYRPYGAQGRGSSVLRRRTLGGEFVIVGRMSRAADGSRTVTCGWACFRQGAPEDGMSQDTGDDGLKGAEISGQANEASDDQSTVL